MEMNALSLILDVAVLAALAGTIYYAQRLSRSLTNFRAHRNEMKTLIAELAKNINDAQDAIDGLKATSNKAADNLDDVLHDSRRMGEELKLINETSESLANRLEGLASKSSQNYTPDTALEEEYFDEPLAANTDNDSAGEVIEPPSFFIRDQEFEADDETEEFISEAEKELMEALKGGKKNRG